MKNLLIEINPCGKCMQMSQLDITVVGEIEELQGQSLSSYVENRGNVPVATKLSKTDQF